jgi:lipoxygenase
LVLVESKEPKRSKPAALRDWSKKSNLKAERVHYTAEFTVDSNFGVPGAITVSNKHQQEFFMESITIEGFACGPVHFPCNSWIQSKKDHPGKRILFSNKVCVAFLFFFNYRNYALLEKARYG